MKVFVVTKQVISNHVTTDVIGVCSTLDKAKEMAAHQYPVKREWQRIVDGVYGNRLDVSGNIDVTIECLEVDELAIGQHSKKG